jgi:hypothetical protein
MNNNNGSEMNKVNTNKIVSSDAEEILKLARQQKAEYEQERLEWRIKDRERAKNELKLMSNNSLLEKKVENMESQFETSKYETVLNQEIQLGDNQEIKLTPEQESARLLATVIANKRKQAESERAKKTDNTFYL